MKHLMTLASAIMLSVMMTGAAFGQETAQQALDANNVSEAVKLLMAQSSSDDAETAISGLCGEAQIAIETGDFAHAQDCLKKAEEKQSELKKKNGWNAVVLWLKADLARHQDNKELYVSTLKDLNKSLSGGVKVDKGWKASINYLLCLETEDNSDARDYAEEAADGFHAAKRFDEEALAYTRLAKLEWDRDKQRRAIKAYESAIKAYENSESDNAKHHIVEVRLLLIRHLIEASEIKQAKSQLDKAAKAVEEAGNPPELMAVVNELKSALGE